jgi:hypothetical protein
MRTVLLIIGSLLPVISTVVYIVSILRGYSKPQRMTRLLMVVISLVSFVALWAVHDTSGIWLALVSLIQAVVLWQLSFKKGIGGSSRLDWACLVLCFMGVLLWLAWGESLLGLLASIVADMIACIPSLHKTIRMPRTESMAFYALDTVAGALILAAGPFNWEAMLFPAYIVVINAAFVAFIAVGNKRTVSIPPTAIG